MTFIPSSDAPLDPATQVTDRNVRDMALMGDKLILLGGGAVSELNPMTGETRVLYKNVGDNGYMAVNHKTA